MNKTIGIILIIISVIGFVFIGVLLASMGEVYLMRNYDLYNCIYINADNNGFSDNPYLIKKIQDECICFREHNYTNLLEADC